MDTLFILAQVCGLIVLVLTVIGVQLKSKENILILYAAANLVMSIQYFLLWALTGAIISIINTIRCIVFYIYKKKSLKPSIIFLIVFEVVTIVSGVLSWQNPWSLIPIIATIIYTYGLWQDNTFIIRLTTGIVGGSWAVYNIIVKAYIGAVQEFAQLISSIIAIIINDKKNKKMPKKVGECEPNKEIDINAENNVQSDNIVEDSQTESNEKLK